VTSTNIPKNLCLATTAVLITVAASIGLALTLGRHGATYAAVAATALAVAWWVRYAYEAAKLPAEYEEIAAEVESSRKALRAMLRTCYSLVAAINDAESVSLRIRREIFSKMGELDESVTGLRGALVTLREMGPAESGAAWTIGTDGAEGGYSGPGAAGGRVSELIETISTSLENMTAVMRDVHHDAKELLSSAGETSYSVSRLDSFLQDMVRSGKELESSTETANRVALEGIKVIEEMEKENHATIASVKKAAKSVSTLGMWSQEIGKIIQVIKDIADETNLLALNVAIIASQSGEHGKAFGVVAEEIRGLAERTSSSTKEITDLITTVQTSVSNVMVEMKESVDRVERGEVLVGNAGKVIEKISGSFESARRAAHEIATKTSEHRMDSNHVVRSFQNVAEIARRLDTSKSTQGAMSGRGATAAQMLKVLTQVVAPARRERTPVADFAAVRASSGGSGLPVGDALPLSPGRDSLELLDKGVNLLDGVGAYIDSVRDGLTVYFDAVVNTSSLIRAIARQLHVPCDAHGFKRCWEEFEHPEEVKASCPAYGQVDWRCFLTEGIDRSLCGDASHSPAGCYTCPVFRRNMDNLLPESECSADG
jgi:hypothetical protein